MARPKALGVWLDGVCVAELEQRRFPEIRLRYTEQALATWPLNSPVISCSLPLSARPRDASHFCRGLLPEGQALQTLAADAGLPVNATYELLARYGRDVAGALVISEDPPQERRFGVELYTAEALDAAIDNLESHPLGSHDDSELSLAGLQDKILLVSLGDGGWGRPLHGRPSTHILKVDDRRRPGLVEAESMCLDLARASGLTSIEHQLTRLGETDCLIVSRFDRLQDGAVVRRIHQEDVCQALDLDHEANRGRGKYETGGGPSLQQVAELLDTYADDPRGELDRLVAAVTFTVLVGNADAHGKNVALLHPTPTSVTLAPLYDTVPTALWPKLRVDAAMSIGGRRALPDVTLADIVGEARAWAHPESRAEAAALDTITRIAEALDHDVVPESSAVARFIRARAARLLDA